MNIQQQLSQYVLIKTPKSLPVHYNVFVLLGNTKDFGLSFQAKVNLRSAQQTHLFLENKTHTADFSIGPLWTTHFDVTVSMWGSRDI